MKQGRRPTSTPQTECRPASSLSNSVTPSRLRATPHKPNKDEPASSSSSAPPSAQKSGRAGSIPSNTRRPLLLNKPKSAEEVAPPVLVNRPGNRPPLEQFARPRRRTEPNAKQLHQHPTVNPTPDQVELLQQRLLLSQALVQDLQAQVLALQSDLHKAQTLNVDLQSHNQILNQDLAAAQAKLAALATTSHQGETIAESQNPKFKEIQKLIANKLEYTKVKSEANIKTSSLKAQPAPPMYTTSKAEVARVEVTPYASPPLPPPPPPPPPPPRRPPARAANAQKAVSFVEFYHSLTKQEGNKESPQPGNHNKPVVTSAHSSIVGEIQNRSAHLLAIKVDIETKGDFINGLIQKVLSAAYTDIEDVMTFVDWLDGELSSLADEQAVLKHFKWPEKKADAMREAAIEYRSLKVLEREVSSYEDDFDITCGTALKKMGSLLDRSEQGIQRLIKLRNSVMLSYQDFRIPTDWMLDSGIVCKIKQASMKLAKIYMNRVTMELQSCHRSERESAQEALLLQGVRFAYRAHQFAGGFDSETLCAFEEIRQRVPAHLGGSGEVLAGIPSS